MREASSRHSPQRLSTMGIADGEILTRQTACSGSTARRGVRRGKVKGTAVEKLAAPFLFHRGGGPGPRHCDCTQSDQRPPRWKAAGLSNDQKGAAGAACGALLWGVNRRLERELTGRQW